MKRLLIASLLFTAAAWQAMAEGCRPAGDGTLMTGEGRFRVSLRTEPAAIQVGSPFRVVLSVCSDGDATIEQIAIDATMPAHRHGMNYKPEVIAKGDRRFEGQGFLFHMPGVWQFAVTIHSSGQPSRLKLDVDIK